MKANFEVQAVEVFLLMFVRLSFGLLQLVDRP